jgi:molybdopterin-guanine dinucleotide biosynthesis protein MobB
MKFTTGKRPPAVAFVARSGTGKTTLVEALIAALTARGLRVGAMKHDAHRFAIDRPGKDSARFTAAGAEVMVLVSEDTVATIRRPRDPVPLDDLLDASFADLDLVLVEGYKTSALPKIEVHRAALSQPLLCRGQRTDDPHLVAVVSDTPLEIDVPVLDLAQPETVADFLIRTFLPPR